MFGRVQFQLAFVVVLFLLSLLSSSSTAGVSAFSISPSRRTWHVSQRPIVRHAVKMGSVEPPPEISTTDERRVLGSQENLMLPRQYGPNEDVTFPQLNHVMVCVLNATPTEEALRQALELSMITHPLLRAHVEGDGEPDKRIDLFQMVREGEPNPLTFVAPPVSTFASTNVLDVVDIKPGVDMTTEEALNKSWQESFQFHLDDDEWCQVNRGPLWKIQLHRIGDRNSPCALLVAFNHAISDQGSANVFLDELIANIDSIEKVKDVARPAVSQPMPLALEDSVLGRNYRTRDNILDGASPTTAAYVLDKALEGFKGPVIVPDGLQAGGGGPLGALTVISGKAAGGKNDQMRKSTVQFRKFPKERMKLLLEKCRSRGVSVTNALSAAVTLAATDYIDGGDEKGKKRNYKILQSLDMRRFGDKLDNCETVACMASSMDLMYGPLKDRSGKALLEDPSEQRLAQFWDLAREGKKQTERFVSSGGPQEAARVFDFTMSISDLNNLVHVTSLSKDTLGRAYSAGITNVGVYERQQAVRRFGEKERDLIKLRHGRYEVKEIYAGTSHSRTGCLYPVTCMTVGGELQCTFHPATPVVSQETASDFAEDFIRILETAVDQKDPGLSGSELKFASNVLPLATAAIGIIAVATHGPAYQDFFHSVSWMRDHVADPADFWGALNFWIFFAASHPLLPPILKLSDLLHGSPGPLVADLVPASFLVGNLLAIGAITFSSQIRNAVNIGLLAAFFAYVGAGLDGQAGLGDYNLALDDGYQGKVVRGCPSYDDVRQSSMDNFNLEKYQGKWYEHKFHDWTQFKEVYDTTLDIKLTEGGRGWIDDFAVKGPAPDSAPLSWDKSPVANGAHYFLFGRIDENDPPGVLREKGFGVEFPNYIVDVKKDPDTGEYKEAIQFQCLERGDVRVFEGINFLSRNPVMTDEDMTAMHARAEKAGMYPYGASPEQMHTVARRPLDARELDNDWQAMWKAIGFDRLLELVTESIEDDKR